MPEIHHSDPASAAVKPSIRSVEAWVTLALAVVGAVMASGLLDPADPAQAKVMKILGVILAVAPALGFTASRTSVKNRATEAAAEIALARIDLLKSAGVGASVPTSPASS